MSIGMDRVYRITSVSALGGYYEQANYVKPKSHSGYIQKCMSEKCCSVTRTNKYFSKKLKKLVSYTYVHHFLDSRIKFRTCLRSELKDNCSDCGSSLFTERSGFINSRNK